MRAALAAEAERGEQVLVVRQEALHDEPRAELERVQHFLGLDPLDLAGRVPPDNTSFPQGPRPELAAEDVFWMNAIAGRTIRAGGYERRTAPRRPLAVLRSLVRLPFWAAWNLPDLRRITSGSITRYLWRWVR
jgi:hypothetical protein